MNAKLSKIITEAVAENNASNKVLKTETAAESPRQRAPHQVAPGVPTVVGVPISPVYERGAQAVG